MKTKNGNILIIVALIVVVVITVGIVSKMFTRKTQESAPQTVTQATTDAEQIKSTVKRFYEIYFGILAKADADFARTNDPVQFGDQIRQQEAENVMENFFVNTDETPFACTTDWAGFSMKNSTEPVVSNDRATTEVSFLMNNEELEINSTATLSLTKVSNTWKIDNITCNYAW